MNNQLYYLELTNDPIRFDAVSLLTNVFFDDSNRQVHSSNISNVIYNHIRYTCRFSQSVQAVPPELWLKAPETLTHCPFAWMTKVRFDQ